MPLDDIDNQTPFAHFVFEKMGPGQIIYDVIIIKAACDLRQDRMQLITDRAEIHIGDEHYAKPETTSLWRAGDLLLHKPATDLFLTGAAQSPKGMEDQWACELIVETKSRKYQQQVHLLGPRHWQYTMISGWHLSKPAPVERLPLRYELAFGGRYPKKGEWIEHAPNPIGVGFYDKAKMDKDIHYPAPQIQYLHHQYKAIDDIVPSAGFGPIPRFWEARSRFAGTYDAAWEKQFEEQDMPDYPKDFDYRFFQAAHPDWIIADGVMGGEWISLTGFHGAQGYRVQLPQVRMATHLLTAKGERIARAMGLDTIEIALDESRVYLTWRLTVPHRLEVNQGSVAMQPLSG